MYRCPECGELFEPINETYTTYCSAECVHASMNAEDDALWDVWQKSGCEVSFNQWYERTA